jgi:protein-tyrosine phosphatase
MRSILFVCTANLCRSPTAEGVLRTLLAREGLGNRIEIDSAGTHDFQPGKPPAAAAVKFAREKGYDITGCVARSIGPRDYDHFDMILAMDLDNLDYLKMMAPTWTKPKIELLLEYGTKYRGREVPDPFGGKEKHFRLAFDMIEDGCRGLVARVKRFTSRHP